MRGTDVGWALLALLLPVALLGMVLVSFRGAGWIVIGALLAAGIYLVVEWLTPVGELPEFDVKTQGGGTLM